MNVAEINAKLFKAKAEKITVYPCRNVRASAIGHPCERYIYLSIKNWQDKKPHDVGLQNIFDLGNTLEEHTIKNIKEAGYEVITPTVRAWNIEKPYISGREDIRIKDENGELIPVEIKGLSPFDFDKLNTVEDFKNSKKAHIKGYPAQLQIYMLHFGKETGFFAITNKLTGETKFIEMQFDYDYAESLLQKAERIYKALEDETPPEACEDISFCEGCALAHVCGECRRVPADVDLDEELDKLIERKQELAPAKAEFEKIDREIKSKVGERDKVITRGYLIQRAKVERKGYTVQDSVYYKINIKRL